MPVRRSAYLFGAGQGNQQFDAVRWTIEAQLSDVKVCKISGETEKQVYIVGKAAYGRWAGLKTTVVETS